MTKKKKKTIIGRVASLSMEKALVLDVQRSKRDKIYSKQYIVNKKIKARCDDPKITVGDIVEIIAQRPQSKDIHYKVLRKVEK